MNFDGKLVLARTRPEVWDFLLDVERFAACVPGVQHFKKLDEHTFQGTIGAAVGPISGAFNFCASILESRPPHEMLARLEGTDSATKSKLDGKIALTLTEPAAGQTELAYNATVGIQGRLAILGDMILRATATLMLEQFFARLRAELEGKSRET